MIYLPKAEEGIPVAGTQPVMVDITLEGTEDHIEEAVIGMRAREIIMESIKDK